ncbi:MAG TPA: hypothetical protein VGM41_02470 [Chitinophagaceae bacterium]|jgi:hypothetical protein
MKKQFFRTASVRRVVNKLALTAIVMAAGIAAEAQVSQVKQPIAVHTASVTYIGSQDDMLSISVKYDNAAGTPFTVTVKGEDGYLLYQGNFRDKNFSKIFRLPKSETTSATFTIRNAKTRELQSFEVNTQMVEEVVVKTN